MYGISTLTQKGQVVIPKPIRDKLGLKTADRIEFTLQNGRVVGKRVITIDEAYGMFTGSRRVTKKSDKQIIQEAVVEKLKKKGLVP